MIKDLHLTIGTVVTAEQPFALISKQLIKIQSNVEKICASYELVLVLNGLTAREVDTFRSQLPELKFMRLLILASRCSRDLAQSAVLENSIGDYCVVLDSLQDPPELLPIIMDEVLAHNYEIFVASCKWERYPSRFLGWIASLYYSLCSVILRTSTFIDPSEYTCLSRNVINTLMNDHGKVRSVRFIRSLLGFKSGHLSFSKAAYPVETYHYPLRSRVSEALETLFSYSTAPLKVLSLFAFAIGSSSLLFGLYALLSKILMNDIASGWTSLVVMISILFALLFSILGVLGFSLCVISKNTSGSPSYLILKEIQESTLFEKIDVNVVK